MAQPLKSLNCLWLHLTYNLLERGLQYILMPPNCRALIGIHTMQEQSFTNLLPSTVQSEIPKELGAKKSYLQGTDKQGRSLSVVICSRHSRSKRNIEECRR